VAGFIRARALPLALAAVVVCAACGGTPSGSSQSTGTPKPSPTSSVDPGFFTWQQTKTFTDERAEIAATVWASEYYTDLMFRDFERSRSELRSLTTEQTFAELGGTMDSLDPKARGPMTARLMSIDLDKGGSWATVSWCTDKEDAEIKPSGESKWRPARKNSPYFAFTIEFIKADSSPTGWRQSHLVDKRIDADDCADSFDNDKPTVEETGPPPLDD